MAKQNHCPRLSAVLSSIYFAIYNRAMHAIRSKARPERTLHNPFARRRADGTQIVHARTEEAVSARLETPSPHLPSRNSSVPQITAVTDDGNSIEEPEQLRHNQKQSWREKIRLGVKHDEDDSDQHDPDEFRSVYLGRRVSDPRQYKSLMGKIPVGQQVRAVVFGSWINLLLLFIPAGFVVNYLHAGPPTIFAINFLAILPSGAILSYAIDELVLRVGDTFGGLLSMTFSNAVQLITSILLLKSRQILILQSSLLGSILSNLLLMTGLGFFFGGINRLEQYFNPRVAQTISMLLLLAVLSLLIPTASHLMTSTTPAGIRAQSRGTSVIILISYGLWLLFQLKTNRSMFNEPSKAAPKAKVSPGKVDRDAAALREIAHVGARTAAMAGGSVCQTQLVVEGDDEDPEIPTLSLTGGIATLVTCVVLIAFNTQFATDSLQGLLQHAGVSHNFVGLVILPILSNDPSSIRMAVRDKMDISIALTLERCMQTSLMVLPLVVLLAWCMGIDDMSIEFDGFSVAALFASIIIVTYVVQEGKSNWLTGALLIKVYIIIALASFYVDD
ncbi:hypothetical protein BU16DRAFT_165087 [Lophium mytilinum]|uniref:Sodium/calcium exchanger membrane region domain-containing protein n=1 Tax=Lophium mytilinum TaxID=390894 RepID=A0A6A6QCF2_9PEZI|nr:hypothetical protein BU16DRAFT_165087 [Lophium mytilinum]